MADESAVTPGAPAASAPEATPAVTAEPTITPDAGAPQDSPDDALLQGFLQDETLDAPDAVAAPDPNAAPVDWLGEFTQQSPYIQSKEHLQGAVADASQLWDVVEGKQDPSALFEAVRATNPQAYQNIMQKLVPYIEQVTGQKFGGQSAEAQLSPEMQRVQALETRLQQEAQQREVFAFNQRVEKAAGVLKTQVETLLKGSFMESETGRVMEKLAAKFGTSKEQTQRMAEQIERGNFTEVDKAVKAIRHEERLRFNRYAKAIVEERKRQGAAFPKSGASTGAAAPGQFDLSTREGRMAYSAAQFSGDATQ